jgi:hypothetical protein
MAQQYFPRASMSSAVGAKSITVATATHEPCRGVYIGTSQSLDLNFAIDGWVTFAGCVAGTIIPVSVIGARKTAASAAPDAGDVVFLY